MAERRLTVNGKGCLVRSENEPMENTGLTIPCLFAKDDETVCGGGADKGQPKDSTWLNMSSKRTYSCCTLPETASFSAGCP